MFDEKFYNNHNHTEMSNKRILDCVIKVEDLIDNAINVGYSGLSITDHESISAHIRAIKYIKEQYEKGRVDKDFKVGLGDEIYLVDDINETKENYKGGITKFYHFVLVAKDKIGHRQLREISSTAWGNSFRTGKMERVPIDKKQLESIITEKGHLIASTACIGGELANLVLQYLNDKTIENKKKIDKFIKWCISIFGKDNFYIELQPSHMLDQIEFNKFALTLSKAYGIKAIITTDTHYLKKQHRGVHKAYLNSREGDREIDDFYATTYMMTTEEIWEYVKDYISEEQFKEIIHNTNYIRENIEFYDLQHGTIVPEIDLSETEYGVTNLFHLWYDKCPYIKKYANSEYEQDKFLLWMIEEGFKSKKEEFNDENICRIDKELEEVWETSEKLNQRVSAYYNLVDKIVDLMWEIGFVGVSRGSVTGFYICYLIDIHQMNPIKWNLPHWRHLTKDRPEMPRHTWASNVNVA